MNLVNFDELREFWWIERILTDFYEFLCILTDFYEFLWIANFYEFWRIFMNFEGFLWIDFNEFFQYRVECLENELIEAKNTIEDQKGQVLVKRSDEDIAKIEEQENVIDNLQQEVSYVKKELIEARAHKSASDDKLSTVQDKIETLQNNINSLTDEGKV